MLKDVTAKLGINSKPEAPKLDERMLVKRLALAIRPNRLSLSQHIEKYVTYLEKTRPVARLYR
ncbi:MAG TPA: hypothetical protein EYG52_12260 [Pseudomonadales bacterium]|nr:hypothetical protein [Pseudomonadales bacterium]